MRGRLGCFNSPEAIRTDLTIRAGYHWPISAVETVYVALRDEGVDVWRPVEAERISESVYRLANVSVPDAEEWEFSPGSTVQCELRELSDGQALVAVFAA